MIKINNKLLVANNKLINVTSTRLYTFLNTSTTNSTKFYMACSDTVTIYFDAIPVVITARDAANAVTATLPELKNYDVIISDEDLPKITKLTIGNTTDFIKNVISNRVAKLINCTDFTINNNSDPIFQQLPLISLTNLKVLTLYSAYKTLSQETIDSFTNMEIITLYSYRSNLNITNFITNNINLTTLHIVMQSGYTCEGNINNLNAINLTYIHITSNISGTLNMINNYAMTHIRINNAANIVYDSTLLNTTTLKEFWGNANTICNIQNLYSNLSIIPSIYLLLSGTINGSISDVIDNTNINYNPTIYNKLLNSVIFNNIRLLATQGTFSGKLDVFLNIINITSYITYHNFGNASNNALLTLDLSNLNSKALNTISNSVDIQYIGITMNGNCQTFEVSAIRTTIVIVKLNINSNIINIKYIVYPVTTNTINFSFNTVSQVELDSIPNTIFDRRVLYTYNSIKRLVINNNNVSISGTYRTPNLGTYTGNINDLTEDQINNLSNGLDYTGSGSNTSWTTREKVWILVNLKVSSSNNTSRYKWVITY